ncbi:tetratricopeptide repeat protein [Pontibacter sp. G13]|uniref:tetratricopeptide repeat protein n=1 Tax=Pontibacter sp. G13 TaxID=3074898 RepID=UPI00288B0A22|nr:tetratricopeptide repeat protein [Pontibacter sp. G13]WNJ20402.1 tetratricopeptide repeat protein [Pontibacter sp. G13]
MKKLTFFAASMLLGIAAVIAQPSKVTGGIISIDGGDYGPGIEKLEQGISDLSLFTGGKAKKIPKAYYKLSYAYLQVAQDTSMTELRAQYPDAAFRSKKYYDLLKDTEYNEKQLRDATLFIEPFLPNVMFNDGYVAFMAEDYETAKKNLEATIDLNPDYFMTHRLLATTYLSLTDTPAAIASLEKSLDVFNANYVDAGFTPEQLEANQEYQAAKGQISYVSQQLAVIYNAQGKPSKAIETLGRGLEIVPDDEDIKRQELSIYNQNPELFEQARAKFQAAVDANPDDYNVKLAFASLLERNGEGEQAFKYYQEAYKNDPNNKLANYGMFAYYNNKAAEMSAKKADLDDEEEIDAMNAEILKLLETSYPYCKWLHEEDPTEVQWLQKLVEITGYLELDEEMVEYAGKLRELNN